MKFWPSVALVLYITSFQLLATPCNFYAEMLPTAWDPDFKKFRAQDLEVLGLPSTIVDKIHSYNNGRPRPQIPLKTVGQLIDLYINNSKGNNSKGNDSKGAEPKLPDRKLDLGSYNMSKILLARLAHHPFYREEVLGESQLEWLSEDKLKVLREKFPKYTDYERELRTYSLAVLDLPANHIAKIRKKLGIEFADPKKEITLGALLDLGPQRILDLSGTSSSKIIYEKLRGYGIYSPVSLERLYVMKGLDLQSLRDPDKILQSLRKSCSSKEILSLRIDDPLWPFHNRIWPKVWSKKNDGKAWTIADFKKWMINSDGKAIDRDLGAGAEAAGHKFLMELGLEP